MEYMENNEVANSNVTLELQRIVQKIDKLEKMINPNSKKSLILWGFASKKKLKLSNSGIDGI